MEEEKKDDKPGFKEFCEKLGVKKIIDTGMKKNDKIRLPMYIVREEAK